MKKGFTLLELIITSTLLLGILSILAFAIHRSHSLRQQSVRQTALLTQSRSTLDFMATELSRGISTNLKLIASETTSYGHTNNAIEFMMLRDARRQHKDSDDLPVEYVRYYLSTNRNTSHPGYALYRGTNEWGLVDPADLEYKHIYNQYFTQEAGGTSVTVTNIVDASGETFIPEAKAGDTIMVPINSYGSSRVRNWVTTTGGWLEVEPVADSPGTNRINATAIFTVAFEQQMVFTNEPPLIEVFDWPANVPQSTVLSGDYELYRYIPGALPYAEGIYGNSFGTPDFSTNHFIELASVPPLHPLWSNAVKRVSITNYHHEATNTVIGTGESWNNHFSGETWSNSLLIASWTGIWHKTNLDYPPNTELQLHWNTTNQPTGVVSDYITMLSDTLISTNFVYWRLVDQPILPLMGQSLRLAYSLDNVFVFPPTGDNSSTNIPPIPLNLEAVELNEAGISLDHWITGGLYLQQALGTDPIPPFQHQQRHQKVGILVTNTITASNIVTVISETTSITITNHLSALVSEDVIDVGRYEYKTARRDRSYPHRVYDGSTEWFPVTLEEDFDGSEVEVNALWVKEDKQQGFQLRPDKQVNTVVSAERSFQPISIPADSEMLLDGLSAVYFQILRFETKDESQSKYSRLVAWEEGDPSPPVAVDIYIEVIDPAHGRRAANMPDGNKKTEYIWRNTQRLSKRIPLGRFTRGGEP